MHAIPVSYMIMHGTKQWLRASLSDAEAMGSIPRLIKLDTVLLTSHHHCNISLELCYSQRWAFIETIYQQYRFCNIYCYRDQRLSMHTVFKVRELALW